MDLDRLRRVNVNGTLDAVLPGSFRRINRPAQCVDLGEMIEGLISFSHAFAGVLWLEILLARGINDSAEDIAALLQVIARMRLTRVQLNTVARPPLQKFDALPVSRERLQEIAALIAMVPGVPRVEIIAHGIINFVQEGGAGAPEAAAPRHQDGVVYQKDLGEDTLKVAPLLNDYDPDGTWTEVKAPLT